VLKIERLTDRREVMKHYLECDRRRPQLPEFMSGSGIEDVNRVDRWLKRSRLKPGVISGFRQWAYAQLTFADLLQCSVVETVSRGVPGRRLGDLLDMGFLDGWEPIWPNPRWHEIIRTNGALPAADALIIRPAVPSESARYYVEDGSGRAAYLAAHRPTAEVVAYAYLGFDPDPNSEWLSRNLDKGHFHRMGSRYRRVEDVLNGA
jgi:hypothetical protein